MHLILQSRKKICRQHVSRSRVQDSDRERPSSAMIRIFSSDTFGIHDYFLLQSEAHFVSSPSTMQVEPISPCQHAIPVENLQVRCPEEGCPPVETLITDLSVKAPKPGAGRCFMTPGFGHLGVEQQIKSRNWYTKHIVYQICSGSSFLTLNISFHCPEPFCKLGVPVYGCVACSGITLPKLRNAWKRRNLLYQ